MLFSHAVPALRRVLASPNISAQVPLKPADNFPHDKSSGVTLLSFATDYDRDLAHLMLMSVFSYFEAYVRGALREVYDLQGGRDAFLVLAHDRATRYWNSVQPAVLDAKRKLQTRDKAGRVDRLRKYSRKLNDLGFVFPPDLFAVYGALCLARKLEPKGRNAFRAYEIPDLLSEALLLKVTKAERRQYGEIRELRNDIAHGAAPRLTVHPAIKKTNFLRKWAARIDGHIGEHFLVLARYAR